MSIRLAILCRAFCLVAIASCSVVDAQPSYYTTYWPFTPASFGGGKCQSSTQWGNIVYLKPSTTSPPWPLFIYTPARFEPYDGNAKNWVAGLILQEMASRGFLAASVEYDNLYPADCTSGSVGTYPQTAQCIFDDSSSNSAITTLCGLSDVDCRKGVITAGWSHGAALAILSNQYSQKIKATLAFSMSDSCDGSSYCGGNYSCLKQTNQSNPFPITVVNGYDDPNFGQNLSFLQNVTGIAADANYCPPSNATNQNQCWSSSNGAGAYLVLNSQKDPPPNPYTADHCYMYNNNLADVQGIPCLGAQINYSPVFDKNWYLPNAQPTYNWSIEPNLDWLATLGQQRVFSPSGN